jgi:hypothetical protein
LSIVTLDIYKISILSLLFFFFSSCFKKLISLITYSRKGQVGETPFAFPKLSLVLDRSNLITCIGIDSCLARHVVYYIYLFIYFIKIRAWWNDRQDKGWIQWRSGYWFISSLQGTYIKLSMRERKQNYKDFNVLIMSYILCFSTACRSRG